MGGDTGDAMGGPEARMAWPMAMVMGMAWPMAWARTMADGRRWAGMGPEGGPGDGERGARPMPTTRTLRICPSDTRDRAERLDPHADETALDRAQALARSIRGYDRPDAFDDVDDFDGFDWTNYEVPAYLRAE